MSRHRLLSALRNCISPREVALFEDCLRRLSERNPKDWSKDNILKLLKSKSCDWLIYADSNGLKMMAAIAFSLDKQENAVEASLIYVFWEFRSQRIVPDIVSRFIIYALDNRFSCVRGLGKNGTLKAVSRRKQELLGRHASRVTIHPESGAVRFA